MSKNVLKFGNLPHFPTFYIHVDSVLMGSHEKSPLNTLNANDSSHLSCHSLYAIFITSAINYSDPFICSPDCISKLLIPWNLWYILLMSLCIDLFFSGTGQVHSYIFNHWAEYGAMLIWSGLSDVWVWTDNSWSKRALTSTSGLSPVFYLILQ